MVRDDEGIEVNAQGEPTSREKSLMMEKLGGMGNRAVEGVRNAGQRVGSGAREVGGRIREGVEEFQDKRRLVKQGGLKEDYSVKIGNRKRYWLDETHYIVYNPNEPEEREMAEQAIQDYQLYGTVEGEAGDINEIIEAGEAELASKKMNREPLLKLPKGPIINPETANRLAAGGKYLRDARLTDPIPSAYNEDTGPESTDMDEDFLASQPHRDQQSYKPIIPQQMKGRVSKTDGEMFGSSRIPSDREMFGGAEHLVPRIRGNAVRDQEQQVSRPTGPVKFVIPRMSDILPRIDEGYNISAAPAQKRVEDVRPTGPIRYVIPRMDDILPRIYQDQPVAPAAPAQKPKKRTPKPEPEKAKSIRKRREQKKATKKVPVANKPKPTKKKPKETTKAKSLRNRRAQKKKTSKK